MRGRGTRSALRLAGIAAALILVSAAAAAGPGGGYQARAHRLTVQAQQLDTRTHKALLDLYALESQLARARARVSALEARSRALRDRRETLAQALTAAQVTLEVSEQQLGNHLRSLYEQGSIDPIAVVLGAQSLDDAISKLDTLSRIADQNRKVVAVTLQAQLRLRQARVTLARAQRQLSTTLADARQAATRLDAARTQRLAYVNSLRTRQQLAQRQIRDLLATARAVERKSEQLQAAATSEPANGSTDQTTTASPTPSQPSQPSTGAVGGRQLRVSSTGYSLPGHTASGLPVGWGIVAVDPNVIPLGTRMTVPGYGEAVAADVGSAVKGYDIDLWFPTLAQARAWGRRTVVITLH